MQLLSWIKGENLVNILKQIKELRSSNAYQEKASQIQALENKLQELDPSQYQKTSQELLDQQIKSNGLTDSNMDEETKKAVEEAKKDPANKEKKNLAEKKIAQNGANNNLNSLITKTLNKLKKGNLTPQEKQKLAKEFLAFMVGNDYQKNAYQKRKPEVEALLAELQGQKNTQQNPPIP